MGSDACFYIGSSHHICQDYAIAGAHNGLPYAIVSDGCSGKKVSDEPGSPFTDFGSRFLARAAKSCLPETGKMLDHKEIWERAVQMAVACRLRATALDATLLVALQRGKDIDVFQFGDGVVAARRRGSGEVFFTTLKFGNNAPFYLSCLISRETQAKYVAAAGSVATTTATMLGEDKWAEHTVDEALTMDSPCMRVHNFNTDEYDLILLMSDGVESFVEKKTNEPVPMPFILQHLLDFKNYEGEFIRRRVKRFISGTCVELGWRHDDDLSVAGLYIP